MKPVNQNTSAPDGQSVPKKVHTLTDAPNGGGTGPQPGDLLYRSDWETSREITHDEAREIAGRLIASHFRRTDTETARIGIPARPDYDDDLLINAYIKQQARKDAARTKADPEPVALALEAAAAKSPPSRAATYRRLAALLRQPGFGKVLS